MDWEWQFEGKSTSDMQDAFKGKLIEVQDRHVPTKMKGRNGRIWEPWMTREIVSLVKRKKEAYDRPRHLKTDKALEEYSESRRELKHEIRRAKRGHEMSLANRVKENPKAFYAYIRSKRKSRPAQGQWREVMRGTHRKWVKSFMNTLYRYSPRKRT